MFVKASTFTSIICLISSFYLFTALYSIDEVWSEMQFAVS